MVDIVERLRANIIHPGLSGFGVNNDGTMWSERYTEPLVHPLCFEAAAEIERLRAQLAKAISDCSKAYDDKGRALTEVEGLKIELAEVMDTLKQSNDAGERAAQAAETLAAQLAEARDTALDDALTIIEKTWPEAIDLMDEIRALKGPRI